MLFDTPKIIDTEVFAVMPDEFRKKTVTAWSRANRGGAAVDSFLEGPSFDRDGNLYVTDIPHGRIFRISPGAEWELVADYDGESGGVRRGFELREVGGGWRIYVRPEHDAVVRDFVLTQNPTKLSQAALETLAVIAYKQPISRGAIASIRAVNVDSVVRTLLGRGLITEAYTDNETGAIHYETTPLLLTQLGINSIEELPKISPLLDDGSTGFDEQR